MKLLKEMWEGIDYKDYTIEYDRDALEMKIKDAQETGELHFTFDFFIVDKDGNRVARVKSLKDAREWIDEHSLQSRLNKYTDILNDTIPDSLQLSVAHFIDPDDKPYYGELNDNNLIDDAYITLYDMLEDIDDSVDDEYFNELSNFLNEFSEIEVKNIMKSYLDTNRNLLNRWIKDWEKTYSN